MVAKLSLALLLLTCISLFFIFDGQQYVQLSYIKSQQQALDAFYQSNQLLVVVLFFATYTLFTALSLPAAAVLTLLAGAIFDTLLGTIVASFASSIGATIAFLIARFLVRDIIQARYHVQLAKINDGFAKEGAFYVFALRLIPAFPFFIVNIVTALMPLPAKTFYWVSQLGMLPGTIVYVYAGAQLAQINALSDIVSTPLIIAFILLGLFPLTAKKLIAVIRQKRSS